MTLKQNEKLYAHLNIAVFVDDIGSVNGKETEIIPLIASYYAEKYKRITAKNQDSMKQSAYEELLAGHMLYKYLGITSDEQLIRNEHGKPEVMPEYMSEAVTCWKKEYPDYMHKEIHFNLSHSRGYVVFAVSDKPVGIDIESIERMNLKVVRRILRPEQIEHLESNSVYHIQKELTKYWTRYEAIMKLVGTGFSGKLDDTAMMEYEKRVQFYELDDYIIAVAQ